MEIVRSIDGFIICVTNINDEASEEEILDLFQDFGKIKDIQVILDRQTGKLKGYAFIEYVLKEDA